MFRFAVTTVSLAALALSGCSVGPNYRPGSASDLGVPASYSVEPGAANLASREELTRWWEGFGDPELTRLIDLAARQNLDLAASVARLRQAREALVQDRAQLLPSLSGSGGYSRTEPLRGGGGTAITLPDGTITTTGGGGSSNFSLGLDANYQVGLFGDIRRSVEASRADYAAAGYDQASVLLATQAEVARNYILLRLIQTQLANARDSLKIQDDNLEIAGFRVEAGLVSSLDREQARSSRAQTAAQIPSLESSYQQAVARLGVLTGQAPGALKAELEAAKPIPAGPASVGTGIPADLLRQRPDVLRAERNLAAATARIGVAKAALYPALSISGSIDTSAASLSSLADVITGGLFAGLTQAIFNGGRLRSQVRSSEAAADGAFVAYKQAILLALEDVENAVVALNTARAREREFRVALDAASSTALLGRLQYRNGLTDFITLNTAESSLLTARNGISQAQADQATALVQLYNALGGGWDTGTVPVAPPADAPASPPDIRPSSQ